MTTYRHTYREAIGEEPPPSIVAGWAFVDENADRAEELARKWLGGYWASIVAHYEFDKPHLKATPGYEFHAQMYDRLNRPGGMEKMTDFYVSLQPWGTPDQVLEKITHLREHGRAATATSGVFRYVGMPPEEGERNMRCSPTRSCPRSRTGPRHRAPRPRRRRARRQRRTRNGRPLALINTVALAQSTSRG